MPEYTIRISDDLEPICCSHEKGWMFEIKWPDGRIDMSGVYESAEDAASVAARRIKELSKANRT